MYWWTDPTYLTCTWDYNRHKTLTIPGMSHEAKSIDELKLFDLLSAGYSLTWSTAKSEDFLAVEPLTPRETYASHLGSSYDSSDVKQT